jgi:hypothetical protein
MRTGVEGKRGRQQGAPSFHVKLHIYALFLTEVLRLRLR